MDLYVSTARDKRPCTSCQGQSPSYASLIVRVRCLTVTGRHNWDKCMFFEILTESEETVEHRVRRIVNIEYKRLRDCKPHYLRYFDDDRL
jgi:hypothetical protein